jgi:DNA replication protein DnaC
MRNMMPFNLELIGAIQSASESYPTDAEAKARDEEFRAMEESVRRAKRREHLFRANLINALEPHIRDALIDGSLGGDGLSLRAVRKWVSTPSAPRGIALQGGTGCGKTVACAFAIAEFGGQIRSAAQVVRSFGSKAAHAVEDQELMLSCRVLLLDDLGAEHARDREWMVVALRELLESRQSLRTLITTNLSRLALSHAYGDERIASRLERVVWVADPGPDRRRAKP